MAYTYNYLYIAIPTTAYNNSTVYVHSPNKTGFAYYYGTKIGNTTYSLTTAEGVSKSFYVYKYLYSSYSSNFNADSPDGSWLDSYSATARSGYTGLQYSQYYVYKYCSSVSIDANTSLYTAIRTAGDSQSPPIFCFYTTVVSSAYDGSWEKWTTSTTSGTDKLVKRRNYSTSLVKDTTDIGIPAYNTSTRIIRLVSDTANQTTVGVYASGGSVVVNLNNSSYYKGYNLTDGTSDDQFMQITAGTSGEKYYALHTIGSSSHALYAGMRGEGSAFTNSYMYYGAWGNTNWAHTPSFSPVMQSDGTFSTTTYKWCAAFTTRSAGVWEYVQLPLEKGYNYTFKLHTYSQASSEGIILRPGTYSRPSTWSVAIGGTTSAYCTGADATKTYYLKVDADSNMYIYFYTDTDSYIGPTTTTYDSADRPIGTYDTDYSLGDVEVTRTIQTSTITFNGYGGSVGTSSITATYGQAMPSINIPFRQGVNGYYGFEGYWDAASGGTQYYRADGTSAKNWDKTSSSVTLYARWRNLLICDAFVRNGDYGLGMLSKTDPSSSDNRLIIFTSDSPGISDVCGVATHSVYTKVSGQNSITLASGFRCTDGGTPYVSIWDGRYGGNTAPAYIVLSRGRGIVTTSTAFGASNILNPPITFGATAPTSPGISFPRVVAFSTPGGSNYLGGTCNPGSGVTFGSVYAFTIPIAIYKQTVNAISASVSANPINVNATTALTVTATYTNGASRMVLTSNGIIYDPGNEVEMTQNPTGVISLSNY